MSYFLHADMDAFFASVEQLDNPAYRGKPVIVGGLPDDKRSVVSTASYEARKFGVHSAMPIREAYQLCPKGIFVRGNMERYKEKSQELIKLFNEFAPDVRQISIDEAFLDITGTEKLFGPPEELAKKLKQRVREETGLTVSVGLASNRYVAKISSGMSKPDGCFIVENGGEEQFMLGLPVEKIWGAGKKTQELFAKYGYKSCRDIHRQSKQKLVAIFGNAHGQFLYRAVRGEAAELFDTVRGTRSMSAERTFIYDLTDEFEIETALMEICHTLMTRLLDCKWHSRTVFIKIRYADFTTESAQETGTHSVSTMSGLYERILNLFHAKYKKGCSVRLIGAGLHNLETEDSGIQGELFEDKDERKIQLEKCIHEINKKFPNAAIKKARLF
jgi:DNA polymerase-4